jgi:hypothetical protein
VEILFDQSDVTAEELGVNCNPQQPRDWTIDQETGAWVRIQ